VILMRAIIIVIYDDLVCHSIKGSFMCIDATFFFVRLEDYQVHK
jgi:hypothetical protein